MVAGFVVLCWTNIVGNIISAEKRCNYPGRSRVTQLVLHMADMTQPTQSALPKQSVHTLKTSTRQGISVGYFVLPGYGGCFSGGMC